MLHVKTPATSANLGSGFDCIGLALKLYNNIYVEEIETGLEIEVLKKGMFPIPRNESNMIYKTMEYFYDTVGKKMPSLKIIQEDDIPMTRGLGSSAACIVNGLVAANTLSNSRLSKEELAFLAAKMEGHPDNTTPAIFGGVVTGVLTDTKLEHIKILNPALEKMQIAVMIPSFPLSTEKAREILPKAYTSAECVYNMSRTALLTAALMNGDFDKLEVAMDDKIHQYYRSYVIPNMENIFIQSKKASIYSIYLSGAGPTLVSIVKDKEDFESKVGTYLKTLEDEWTLSFIDLDTEGTVVKEIKNLSSK